MNFNTRYNPPESPALTFEQPSMTDRSFKDECDINKIVERCMRVGWPEDPGNAQYGDFANMPGTLQEAFDMMHDAEDKFSALPSDVRRAFDNDPQQFLLSFQDPAKRDLLVAHGLIDVPVDSQKANVPPQETVSNVSSQQTNVVNQPIDKGES